MVLLAVDLLTCGTEYQVLDSIAVQGVIVYFLCSKAGLTADLDQTMFHTELNSQCYCHAHVLSALY